MLTSYGYFRIRTLWAIHVNGIPFNYFPEDSPCEVKSFVRSGDVARDFAKGDAGGDGAVTALATLH